MIRVPCSALRPLTSEGDYTILINHFHEYLRVKSELSRARRSGTPATLLFTEWIGILEMFQEKCAYCKTAMCEVMDHILPIKLGGGTDACNVVPSCYTCNASKDRKGQQRDQATIERLTSMLHTFISEHGPFSLIEERDAKRRACDAKVYVAVSEAHYQALIRQGKKAELA